MMGKRRKAEHEVERRREVGAVTADASSAWRWLSATWLFTAGPTPANSASLFFLKRAITSLDMAS